MGKLLGTHVDGPLADYKTGFMEALKNQGFADWSATSYQGLMAHLSRWLVQHELRISLRFDHPFRKVLATDFGNR